MVFGMEQLAPGKRKAILHVFARTLSREAHIFLKRPDLIWQQLYNRLQWEEEPVPRVLAPELARRSAPGAAPWLRTRTPFRESPALIRTLAGHTNDVNACAISPDGQFIVSARGRNPLSLWHVSSGAELGNLPLPANISCAALHPFRPILICGDKNGSIHRVDLVGIEYTALLVTAWREEPRKGAGRHPDENPVHFGCPACRAWSKAATAALGKEMDCPNCGRRLKINPFTLKTDWRPVAKAWGKVRRCGGVMDLPPLGIPLGK